MPPLLQLSISVGVVIGALALSGCGSTASHHSSSSSASTRAQSRPSEAVPPPTPADDPHSPVIVRVGETKITKAALLRWMKVVSPYAEHEVPVPPEYNACIIALHKKEPIDQGGEGHAANTLKGICEQKYETLRKTALQVLINDAWLTEEAARDAIKLDEAALRQELKESTAAVATRPGGVEGFLRRSGRTASDLAFEVRVGQLSGKIYQFAEHKTPAITPALIASYYAAHKHDFALPDARDLYILHTKSEAAALQAKREIASGRSFASVVKNLHVSQPIGAKEGLTLGLTRKSYAQRSLINAIFSARPGVLSGPLHLALPPAYGANGYYVFQVKRKVPAHQRPYAEAVAAIKAQAPEQLHKKTLAAFVKAYKARWRAQTDCSRGYVVEACRQFDGPVRAGDAFVL
jgi:foldase protein PrsA